MKFTRSIYPYSLRESISRYLKLKTEDESAKNVRLSINRSLYLDLDPSDSKHISIIYNGYYKLGLSRTLNSLARQGGLMLEAQAGAGYFSSLWLKANPNNTVFCFESSAHHVRNLQHNLEKNELSLRAGIVNALLGEYDGLLNRYRLQESFNLYEDDYESGEGVVMFKLDSFMNDNSEIDIELLLISNSEEALSILKGCENLMDEKRIRHIIIENGETRISDLDVPKLLAANSFLLKTCDNGHSHYKLVQAN